MTAMVRDSFGAHGDIARAAAPALASLLDDPQAHQVWAAVAFLLEAIAHETLNDPDATGRALRPRIGDVILTHGETRVLHYLTTNLSAREIARELYLSVNTIKTHQRHLYQKLGVRGRSQAVERARALSLLPASSRRAPSARW